MKILKLIIWREFKAKVINKSFIIMTFLSPLLFVGVSVFVGYLSSLKADQKTIVIHDQSQLFVKEFKSNSEYKYVDFSAIDLKILKDSILKESYEGLLYIPKSTENQVLETKIEYISNNSPSMSQIGDMQEIIENKITQNNFNAANLDTIAIKKAQSNVNISLIKTNGETALKGLNEIKIAIGGAFGYLIMMFIIIYGNMVMRSVIEEKTSRIIEIIVSSVKPFQLMMGKIIGTSLAGILQFFTWAIVGLLLLTFASMFVGNIALFPEGKLYLSAILNLPIAAILIRDRKSVV